MIPIPKEKIIRRIERYRPQIPNPDDSEYTYPLWWHGELNSFEAYPCFGLNQLIRVEDSEVYLSHNGDMYIGLPFEEVVVLFNLDHSPEDIPIIRVDGIGGPYKKRCISIDRNISTPQNEDEACATIHDISLKQDYLRNLADLIEGLFDLEKGHLETSIVQPGYGIRLDKGGPLVRFFEFLIEYKIPLFIRYGELDANREKRFCVLNSIEV